jgi:subtilisin family serine protease
MSVAASLKDKASAAAAAAAAASGEATPVTTTTNSDAAAVSGSQVQAKVMGTGYYSYTPGSAAAKWVNPGSLVTVAASSLNDCLQACSFNNLCSGVVFGAFDASTGGIGDIVGAAAGTKCQRIQGTSRPGNSQRTLIKANYKSLEPY